LEAHVDQLFAAQSYMSPQDADIQREQAYELSENLDIRLQVLDDQLKHTIQDLDRSTEAVLGRSGDVGRIVHIMNQHQDRMAELEALSRKVEADVTHLQAAMHMQD